MISIVSFVVALLSIVIYTDFQAILDILLFGKVVDLNNLSDPPSIING